MPDSWNQRVHGEHVATRIDSDFGAIRCVAGLVRGAEPARAARIESANRSTFGSVSSFGAYGTSRGEALRALGRVGVSSGLPILRTQRAILAALAVLRHEEG
jgi:hypothetical protein